MEFGVVVTSTKVRVSTFNPIELCKYYLRKRIMIFLDFYWTTHPPDRSNLQFSIGQFFIKSIFVRESGQNVHTFCHAMCVLATVRIVYLEQKKSTLSYICITFYTVLDGKMHYMVVYFQFADSRYKNISCFS